MKSSDQVDKLAEALAQAQAKFGIPPKDKTARVQMKNGGTYTYKYAALASVIAAVRAGLSEVGIASNHATVFAGMDMTVITRLTHKSGQWMQTEWMATLPDKLPQTAGSAQTYGMRYGLCAICGIAPDDDDDGATANRTEPAKGIENTPRAQAATKQLGAAFAKGMTDAMEKAGLSREQLVAAIQKAGLGHLCADPDPAKWDASLANQIKGWVQKHQTKTPDQQPGD